MQLKTYCLSQALLLTALSLSVNAEDMNGADVFQHRCSVCHGTNADGESELARMMNPPPANLRASRLTDEEREYIVRNGGAAVGRSPNMPAWKYELSEAELDSVLQYVASVRSVSQPKLSAASERGAR